MRSLSTLSLRSIRANPLITSTIKGTGFPSLMVSGPTLIGLWIVSLILVRKITWNPSTVLDLQLFIYYTWLILPVLCMGIATRWMKGEQSRPDFLMLRQTGLSDQAIMQGYTLGFLLRLRLPLILINGLLPLVIGRVIPGGPNGLTFTPVAMADSIMIASFLAFLSLTWCTLGSAVGVFASLRWDAGGRWLAVMGSVGVLMVGGARLLLNILSLPIVLALPVIRIEELLDSWRIYVPSLLFLLVFSVLSWRRWTSERRRYLELLAFTLVLAGWMVALGNVRVFRHQYRVEHEALVALGMGGPSDDHCQWHGVVCESGVVVELTVWGWLPAGLPPEIWNLTSIEVLTLQRRSLTELPPEIEQLTTLRELYLGYNQIDELPPEIGNLSHLERLSVYANPMTELPPEIAQLSELQVLNLELSGITELPPEIGQLSNLKILYAGYTSMSELPPEIGQLSNLERLLLQGNQITALPPEIGELSNLTVLDLTDNLLEELPDEISGLINLAWLGLNGNPLTSLPPEIGRLSGLKFLDLGDQNLSQLAVELCPLMQDARFIADGNLADDLAALCEGELENADQIQPPDS